jgi:hypothetical protein
LTVTVAEFTDAVPVATVKVGSAEILRLIDASVTVLVLYLLVAALSDEVLVSIVTGSELVLPVAVET